MNNILNNKIKKSPSKPGVYLFKDKASRILYIGKALNLKNRVRSHFSKDANIYKGELIQKIKDIDWIETNDEKNAMLLENQLIKKYLPRYNIQWRDDKSYFWVRFTNDQWPRVEVIHQNKFKIKNPRPRLWLAEDGQKSKLEPIGPFVSGRELKLVLKYLRKIFPFRTCKNPYGKPCLGWHLSLCCAHKPNSKIKNPRPRLRLNEGGQKSQLRNYLNLLNDLSQLLRLYAGEMIRVEAYDISNIQGSYATGSMVVFDGNKPKKSGYRKFRIKTVSGANDVAMLKEVMRRRFAHREWPYPDLILIDGGQAQLNAVKFKIKNLKLKIPVVALAKQKEEIYTEYSDKPLKISKLPYSFAMLFKYIRDEAHRFAIFYYRYLHATRDFRRTRKKIGEKRKVAPKA